MKQIAGTTVKDVLADVKKKFGDDIGGFGHQYHDVARLPTGIFALDLAMGGGIPLGRLSIFYGKESSGKSNLALRCIRESQHRFPNKVCVMCDVEGTIPKEWAEAMGVDTSRWIYLRPDYAEQVIDIVESFLYAEDVSLVVVDSVAAMAKMSGMDQSAEKADVGGLGAPVNRLCTRARVAMSTASKLGRCPGLIFVNQIRYKIGMFGGVSLPGGDHQKFMTSMRVKVWGKDVMEKLINPTLPVRKITHFQIEKWKVPIVATEGEYEMVMIDHDGMAVGDCAEFKLLRAYLEKFKLMGKSDDSKLPWFLFEKKYKTLGDIEVVLAQPENRDLARKAIIEGLTVNQE